MDLGLGSGVLGVVVMVVDVLKSIRIGGGFSMWTGLQLMIWASVAGLLLQQLTGAGDD